MVGSIINPLFLLWTLGQTYVGSIVDATSFDWTQSTYPLAEVKCGISSHEFVLKGIVIDIPPEEGGLIDYNIDIPTTLKALLDLAEQHALSMLILH